MSDVHWESLKEIFNAALALPVQERRPYLLRASQGDVALQQAVESLLKAHEESDHFVDRPAFQAAAEMLIDDNEFATNQTIAHYRIVSLLGEGGMGKVYLAEDTKLSRRVALKFLARAFTKNQTRLERFEQEARAASALNHPNILTIHEISEADGRCFIATEYIEGITLRERLAQQIGISEASQIAEQIASAVVAAHKVGIVHRDLKPENIMIRHEDTLVKVLDFGLAKISDRPFRLDQEQSRGSEPTKFKTEHGAVMGTVAYMSPEQARGDDCDERSDIWSFGVILYEMIAGRSPFIADSSHEILSGILSEKATPPISLYAQDLPQRLEVLVAKALMKKSDERYQSAQDVLVDLRRLRESLQTAPSIEHTDSANLKAGSYKSAITQPVSAAKHITHQVKAHKRGVAAMAAIVFMAILTAVVFYGWRAKHAAAAAPQIKSLAVLPLKSLEANEDYLGVGIADAVIRKISQTGQLTVRPTSAVLKFIKADTDSLTAARQLDADAILEGTIQHAGDRLRVTVNLLRTSDGSSLYTDSFDLKPADVFSIEDKVSQQVASRLQVTFKSGQPRQFSAKYPTDPRAYELYIRGVTSLDERGYSVDGLAQMRTTIDYFKQSIAIDPNYVLSHSKLAFAYAWTSVSIEPGNAQWANLAREQIQQAEALDPNVAETHFARGYMLWTANEGYQTEAALRELQLAKQLNPNICSPDLPAILGHAGLDDLASSELQRALDIDPTSQSLKDLKLILPSLRADADAWFLERKNFPSGFERVEPWYYLRKGLLDDAEKAINERLRKSPDEPDLLFKQALLLALRGKFPQAEARVPDLLARIQLNSLRRHHATYDAACIYALAGNAAEAVKWLMETANIGFPNYALFERDPFLNRIRTKPEFIQFMSDQKAHWEKLQAEFGA